MQERAQQNFEVSMGISAHEVTLDQLANEIAEVYERCGFDRDATVSTLQMLTNIEVSQHPQSGSVSLSRCTDGTYYTQHCITADIYRLQEQRNGLACGQGASRLRQFRQIYTCGRLFYGRAEVPMLFKRTSAVDRQPQLQTTQKVRETPP